MPYAFLNPDGTIKVVAPKPTPFMRVGDGEGLPRHEHLYSHLTMCHAGSVKISNERRSLVMTKDTQPVNLVANEWHEVEALPTAPHRAQELAELVAVGVQQEPAALPPTFLKTVQQIMQKAP
jgi:hypothetical protein